jgi:diguanylate cyclase (GGDEF)-like protein/PAS domain S-box-containing protein
VKEAIFKDKHFYILLALFIICAVFYYFGEIVILFGWNALRWDIFYTVHDPHRMLFLVPILYASYYYRLRGAILANIISLLIFLPRAFFVSLYPDPTLRMFIFVIVATVISLLAVVIFNQRDKRGELTHALQQSKEKYLNILQYIFDAYYEVDLSGKFTFVNDSVCDSLGYTREELIGKNFRLTTPEYDIKRLLLAFNEVFRTGEPNKGIEHKILCKNGSDIPVESSISLRKNERGDIIGFRSISRDVSERKQAEEALRKNRDLLNEMGKMAKVGGWEFDAGTNIQTWTDEVYNIHELSPDHRPTLEEGISFYAPEAIPLITDAVQRTIQGGEPFDLELPFITARGNHRWVHAVGRAYQQDGKTVKVGGIFQDITERKQTEEALHNSEEKYRSLVENINDVFYTLDTEGDITYVSPVVERLTKYKVSDLIGKSFIPLIYPDDLPGLLDSLNRLVSGQLEPWEFRIVDEDGRIIYVRTSSRPLYKDGKAIGITAVMTDITERKQMEHKLEEMATHDFLTGLPNRVLLLDRFNIAAALARRNQARLAVLSLDLDKFKNINDTLGHDAGDQVLKTISARLTGIIRASDTLARVGGDEFILVMLETNHAGDSKAIAQKILSSFREPITIEGHQLVLSTSIGIAIYPDDSEDLETLTKKSDAAMYYSKGHGRNQYKFFADGDVQIGGDHKSAGN